MATISMDLVDAVISEVIVVKPDTPINRLEYHRVLPKYSKIQVSPSVSPVAAIDENRNKQASHVIIATSLFK